MNGKAGALKFPLESLQALHPARHQNERGGPGSKLPGKFRPEAGRSSRDQNRAVVEEVHKKLLIAKVQLRIDRIAMPSPFSISRCQLAMRKFPALMVVQNLEPITMCQHKFRIAAPERNLSGTQELRRNKKMILLFS